MSVTQVAGPYIKDNAVAGTKIAMSSDARGDVLIYDGTNYVRLGADDGKFLRSNGTGSNPSWETAGGASLSGSTDNTIVTVTGADAMIGEATLTYNAGTFTIANAATAQSLDVTTTGTAVTARIQLTSGATGTDGGTSLHFIEGSGNGAANNHQYFMGYRPGDNLFRFYSNSAQGVGSGGGNVFTIADGTDDVNFSGAITMSNQPSVGCWATAGQSNVTGNNTVYIMKWTPIWGSSFMTGVGNITFTAPVLGKYAVSATVEYEPSSTNANIGDLSIITSNRGWHSYTDPNGAGQIAKSMSVVADMDANDTLQIKLQVGGVGSDGSDINSGGVDNPRAHLTIHMVG